MAAKAALLFCLLTAVACRNRDEQKSRAVDSPVVATVVPLAERIGWWHGRCLAISNGKLGVGTSVMLVVTGEPQVVKVGRIGAHVNSPELCAPLNADRAAGNAKPGVSFYALDADSISTSDMGFGIVDAPNTPTVVNGLAEATLSQAEHKNYFTSCTTSEGVRFTVWADKANVGEPVWSGYYYLGYDTTPNCP